jgi:hypothetical protein
MFLILFHALLHSDLYPKFNALITYFIFLNILTNERKDGHFCVQTDLY